MSQSDLDGPLTRPRQPPAQQQPLQQQHQQPQHDKVTGERRTLSLDAVEYLSYLSVERGRAPSSIDAYRRDLLAYEAYLSEHGLHLGDVSAQVIEQYLGSLVDRGLAPSSRARALAALRGLHSFVHDERGADQDPTLDVARPGVPAGLPKALSEGEVTRLIDAVRGDDPKSLRDRAMLEVLYGTGARISELVGLSHRDLEWDAGLLRLFGKGSKERLVPVGRCAREALARWIGPGGRTSMVDGLRLRRDDHEALFISTRGRRMSRQAAWVVVHDYAMKAGLGDRVTPHVLRHSCATHMLDHGADIRVVQEMLGHASITTTQLYTKVSQEHLRRAYLAAHPRAQATRARSTGVSTK